MRIAIFHNYMDNIGGAEMVGLTLARELGCPIYTTNYDRDMIAAMGFAEVDVRSIGQVPINAPWRQQLALLRFRMLDLSHEYDAIIIGGDWAVSGARHHNALWYVHSPIREIWDSYEFVRENMVPWYKRPFFDLWVHVNCRLNKKYAAQVQMFVCNSENTRERVRKYLGHDATVLHPPIDTNAYQYRPHEGYWLSVNRLINHKRIELQLDAFRKLPNEKLIIVGSYEQSATFTTYAQNILKSLPSNVEVRSWVSAEELRRLYGGCIGCISTARDEDFGMTAVEAMAAGKPIIAPNEGGYRETVLHRQTGLLLEDISGESLAHAITQITPHAAIYRHACVKQAVQFNTQQFVKAIRQKLTQMI